MKNRISGAPAAGLILVALSGPFTPTRADLLFTRDLCAPGAMRIGTSWVSLPYQSDMMTAEMLCLAIPLATTVSQNTGTNPPRYTYDCAAGTCDSVGVIPEPGCAASACFCIERGEGFEVVPSAATTFDINGCDTFQTVSLPAGLEYMISVPYDTPLLTSNDLALHIGLPSSGLTRGTVTRTDCVTGALQTAAAGSTATMFALIPGEAYMVRFTSPTAGVTYTNPAACSPLEAPAADTCPIDDFGFTSSTTMTWTAPPGCLLPAMYDTIRGDLTCLRDFCTQSIAPLFDPCPTCFGLEDDGPDTTTVDLTVPPVGTAFWYLARVDGGTWNHAGDMKCTDYDFMLAGSPCP
jgi:hypothetical protein